MRLPSAYQDNVFSLVRLMKTVVFLSPFCKKTHVAFSTESTYFHSDYIASVSCSFNGKEKDYESGFHYYGARYYWSEVLTGWLSVDPMADKYSSISPYAYCAWNPIKLVDPDGRDTLNFAMSKFLRTQPDITNALIINSHGKTNPPLIKNNNFDYDDDFPIMSSHYSSTVATYISNTNVYQENNNNNNVTPVFLISCQTGESSVPYMSFADGLDLNLSNALIIAPVGDVHARNGLMWLYPTQGENYGCYWRVVYNGQDIGRIENFEAFNIPALLSSTKKTVDTYNTIHPENQIQLPELILQ